MPLELVEDPLAQGIGDLGVDAGVLDVFVAQVVGHVLDPAAGFQQMDGHGVAERVRGAVLDACRLVVVVKKLLDLALLQGSLAAGEEIRPHASTLAQIAANQFGRLPPQGLFFAGVTLSTKTLEHIQPVQQQLFRELLRFDLHRIAHAELLDDHVLITACQPCRQLDGQSDRLTTVGGREGDGSLAGAGFQAALVDGNRRNAPFIPSHLRGSA
jgi:hypothetical protein